MFLARLSCSILVGAVLLVGCSRTPTNPSAVAPNVAIGEVPQTSVPVPPRITIAPSKGVGLTRFAAFGDSITWGATSGWDPRFMFAAANGGFVERLQAGLDFHHAPQRFTVFNEGIPGELAINGLVRFQHVLTTRRPQAVLLLEGINDISSEYPVSRVITSLRQMLDAAAGAGVPVLIATMYQTYGVTDPTGGYRHNGAESVVDLNAGIRTLATGRLNVHLVDLYPHMTARDNVGADGVHTTDKGFEVMATVFLEAIEKAFPVRGSFQ